MHVKVKLSIPQLMHGRMLSTKEEHFVSKEFADDFVKRGVGEITGTGAPAPVEEKKAPPPPPLVMAATPVAAPKK
jgi:hypothetical protein